MNAAIHAADAQFLITMIAALIPLLIWAFRGAEDRLAEIRAELMRRFDRR